jgi:hypothetical protein
MCPVQTGTYDGMGWHPNNGMYITGAGPPEDAYDGPGTSGHDCVFCPPGTYNDDPTVYEYFGGGWTSGGYIYCYNQHPPAANGELAALAQ